jgi:uncharacterized protein (DUF2344 family)
MSSDIATHKARVDRLTNELRVIEALKAEMENKLTSLVDDAKYRLNIATERLNALGDDDVPGK